MKDLIEYRQNLIDIRVMAVNDFQTNNQAHRYMASPCRGFAMV